MADARPDEATAPTAATDRAKRVARYALLCGAFYLLASAAIAWRYPYRRGFDDFDHIPAALHWAQTWTLDSGGPFLRVPFWSILLGTSYRVFGTDYGLFALQAGIVLGSIACFFAYVARRFGDQDAPWIALAPILVFALSPQTLLYSRHAVNDLFIGLLAMSVMLIGESRLARRALWMGAVVGIAFLTKVVAILLVIPALVYALRDGGGRARLRSAGEIAVGIVAVSLPLLALHVHHRGWVPLDTTSAYNLSPYWVTEWRALGDHAERYRAGMEAWRTVYAAAPADYWKDFVGRLAVWLGRPASADFALYMAHYPQTAIRVLDALALYPMVLLAALGTTRRQLGMWAFLAAIAVGCTFPLHTPYSPKVTWLFPCVLLAPFGILKLRDALKRRG